MDWRCPATVKDANCGGSATEFSDFSCNSEAAFAFLAGDASAEEDILFIHKDEKRHHVINEFLRSWIAYCAKTQGWIAFSGVFCK